MKLSFLKMTTLKCHFVGIDYCSKLLFFHSTFKRAKRALLGPLGLVSNKAP